MKKILYFLSKEISEEEKSVFFSAQEDFRNQVSVIFLRLTDNIHEIGDEQVYILDDESTDLPKDRSYPLISYQELLKLVFQSDTVLVV